MMGWNVFLPQAVKLFSPFLEVRSYYHASFIQLMAPLELFHRHSLIYLSRSITLLRLD
jgi:hypothetical protein